MKKKRDIKQFMPEKPVSPFTAPEGYFDSLKEQVMQRIQQEDSRTKQPVRKISLRPYLSLAASITGLALVIYLLLQTLTGSRMDNQLAYDLTLLEQTGIAGDDEIVFEAFSLEDEETGYSDWEKEAMVYLCSNEVDLVTLLESNE